MTDKEKMSYPIYKCVVWGVSLKRSKFIDPGQNFTGRPSVRVGEALYEVYNPRAGGKYKVEYIIYDFYKEREDEEKIRLSGYIAQENLKGNIPDLDKFLQDSSWEKLPPVPEQDSRENLLLDGLIKLSPKIGHIVSLYNIDDNEKNNPTPFLYALSYCSTISNEFHELLDSLEKSEDIVIEGNYTGGQRDVKVTKKGRERIKKVNNKTPNRNSMKVFIAMWMHDSMEEVKRSIKTAVENAGYEPLRIDDINHDEKIDDRILSEIEKSKFIVCDITSSNEDKPRASVFFEAGYAKGKGIPVIWSCDKTMKEMQENAFDTRQYAFLFWDENNMLGFEKELQKAIENNEKIGKGPLKGGKE